MYFIRGLDISTGKRKPASSFMCWCLNSGLSCLSSNYRYILIHCLHKSTWNYCFSFPSLIIIQWWFVGHIYYINFYTYILIWYIAGSKWWGRPFNPCLCLILTFYDFFSSPESTSLKLYLSIWPEKNSEHIYT